MHRHHRTATQAGVLAPLMKSKTWQEEEETDQGRGTGVRGRLNPVRCPPWPNF